MGDSWGQGDGLELTYCFDHLLRDELEKKLCCRVGIWNLSHGGKGYDYIARALMCSLPHLHPDIVIPIFGVIFGDLIKESIKRISDLSLREKFCLYPFVILIIFLGFYPLIVLNIFSPSLGLLIESLE